MKKISILFILFMNSIVSNGQTYFPMLDSVSNVWHFTGNIVPIRQEAEVAANCDYNAFFGFESNSLFTTGDTLIGIHTYKKITHTAFAWPGFDCNYGYIREDSATQQIYFMDNVFSPEELIYDFSMVPGNTINLTFLQPSGYYQSGTFTLDSTGVIQINAGSRRIFYLSNHNAPFSPMLQWIESVGHPGYLVYTKSANMWGGLFSFMCLDQVDRNFYQILTCFEHNSQKVYFDSCSHAMAVANGCFYYADSCNYWNICGSLDENNAINIVQIAPNPFATETNLVIEASRSEKLEVTIYSVDGRFIKSQNFSNIIPGKNIIPISFSATRSGMYFVEIKSGDQSYFLKIVKTGDNF